MTFRVYTVTDEDVGYSGLEQEDVGRRYIIVQGCIHFVETTEGTYTI